MKKYFCLLTALLIVFLIAPVKAEEGATMEVLFMNHGPLRSTIKNISRLADKYEGKLAIAWYDFDSKEGSKFMNSKGINEHIPLMIWINGSPTQIIEGKDITFKGFPSGSGPAMFQGEWDMEMLEKAINQAIR